ncbi:hypothetical protein FQN54_006396 [Arachnomyces sp. PD_36]|nr:hypothetical protein FQN54_006396 [Arachnomyces sp. PD_36]
MSTMNRNGASQIRLSKEHLGMCRVADIPAESLQEAARLLQKNHNEAHIFWREANGHNHTVHNLLTSLALGASPSELQQAFEDDEKDHSRPKPAADESAVREMVDAEKFYERLGQDAQYSNFLAFFEQEIDAKGWKSVINEYCFSRTRNADALLARLFDGAFHPIIHLGLGVEFELPSIIAEGLAQAATDRSLGVDVYFRNCEQEAAAAKSTSGATSNTKPLVELFHEAYANEGIRHAARWEDVGPSKMSRGVLGRGAQEIVRLGAQFRVDPETLEQRTAEMISCCAYMAGAAQRPGKPRKIDFFYMHDVTGSIFLTVLIRQPWISAADKVRLVEHKARLDLVWYATCGAAQLNIDDVKNYDGGPSASMDWDALFRAINTMHDDGHVAKFARALKNGEEVSKKFEEANGSSFPVKGDMWLRLARMAYDTNLNLSPEAKWIFFTGFDQPWSQVPLVKDVNVVG